MYRHVFKLWNIRNIIQPPPPPPPPQIKMIPQTSIVFFFFAHSDQQCADHLFQIVPQTLNSENLRRKSKIQQSKLKNLKKNKSKEISSYLVKTKRFQFTRLY